ncbi:hypothetical protein PV04_00576 [Phialophora macrospora]|uniref:Uncharacterized protein n=1 Tax=Phialophora macrospora TaxID=1851006 RepID=A0A0D2FV70_9EURO|nr:hypothetical protein PV04_00576 [Phialophora macrospora]
MAPRGFADQRKRQTYRVLKPSSSTDVYARVGHSFHRPGRNGTVTQLETVVPLTPPRSRYSPSSKTKLLLATADELNVPEELAALRGTIDNRRTNNVSNGRFIPFRRSASPGLKLADIDDATSPEEVEGMIQQITDYFDFWSNGGLEEGPASLFADMRLINRRLDVALELFGGVTSSRILDQTNTEFRDLYERFVNVWSKAAHEALVDKLDRLRAQLQARITRGLTAIHEIEFTSFVLDVAAVSPCSGLQALLGSAYDTVPFLVSEVGAKGLFDCAEALLSAFQDVTYDTEAKELWLLIWRSLKTVFAAFDRGGAPTSPTNTLRDRRFFEIPEVLRELKRLSHTTEAANPRSIEGIVGRYCRYIHKCQVDPGNKYESLQRTQDRPLGEHTKNALKKFIKTGKFETSTLSKIHFAVGRFNKINGGPAKAIRWRSRQDDGEWAWVPIDLDSPVSAQPSPSVNGQVNVQHVRHPSSPLASYSPAFNVNGGLTENPANRIFPYPEGINIKSDFDYVWYPSPETRAHEVVQNEQISRELGRPGILSEGPRPEYLINRPPHHARGPSEFTEGSLGPFSCIRSAIYQLLARKRVLPDSKTPTFSRLPTSRGPLPLESGSAILDRRSKVHKPISSGQVSRLRGGDGRAVDWSTGASGRHHFDAAAFHRKMVASVIWEVRGRYGLEIPIDVAKISKLLPETGYDVREVATRYTAPGRATRDRSTPARHVHADARPCNQNVAADQSRLLPSVDELGVDEHAGASEYRVNNSPRATPEEWEEQYLNEHHEPSDDDQENLPPRPAGPRIPLGEMHPGDYPIAQSDESSLRPESEISDRPVRVHCHPCPTFAGQYHHDCPGWRFCPGYEPVTPPYGPTSPTYPFDDDVDDNQPRNGPDDEQRREQHNGGGSLGNNGPDGSFDVYQDDERSGEQDSRHHGDKGGHDDDRDQNENITPPAETPPAEEPAAKDDQTLQSLFGDDEGRFATAIGRLSTHGFAHIQEGFNSLGQDQNPTADGVVVGNMIPWVESTAAAINKLRDEYLAALKGKQKPSMEIIPEEPSRSKSAVKAHPATYKLCKRAFQDVRFHHGRVLQFFDYTHPRTLLSFRYAFNALIVAVRELLVLLREYHQSIVNPKLDNGDEDDRHPPKSPSNFSVVTPPMSKLGHVLSWVQDVKEAPTGHQPNPLPARKDYENMFVPELCRELEQNRGIKDIKGALGKRNPVKRDYIDKLMALDKDGIVGKGASECYRNITGNWNARVVPKDWNMETALKEYYKKLEGESEATESEATS